MYAKDFREKARKCLEGKWKTAIIVSLVYSLFICILNTAGAYEGMDFVLRTISPIIAIATIVISPAIWYGMTVVYMKLKKGEEVKPFDFLKVGFENFGRGWKIVGNILLKCLPYVITIVVLTLIITVLAAVVFAFSAMTITSTVEDVAYMALSGSLGLSIIMIILSIALIVIYVLFIIKALYYVLATYIAIDNPDMKAKEAVEKSEELMKDKRGRYVCLMLSFIGWMIVAGLVGGVCKMIVEPIRFSLLTNYALMIGEAILTPYLTFATLAFYEHLSGNKEEKVEAKVETANAEEKVEEPKSSEENN